MWSFSRKISRFAPPSDWCPFSISNSQSTWNFTLIQPLSWELACMVLWGIGVGLHDKVIQFKFSLSLFEFISSCFGVCFEFSSGLVWVWIVVYFHFSWSLVCVEFEFGLSSVWIKIGLGLECILAFGLSLVGVWFELSEHRFMELSMRKT